MIQQIGFFHFGSAHSTPKAALRSALEEVYDLASALLVLPEAFNLGVSYRGQGERNFDRAILDDLQELARQFDVVFVAGLVVAERWGPTPPHSAVYFVGPDVRKLMCYKIGSDDMAGINYTPRTGQADFNNPIEYAGIQIGALVCVDANPTDSLTPVLGPRLGAVVAASQIVCVPVHMAQGNFCGGKAGCDASLVSPWRGKRLVVANSKANGIDSFVTDPNGEILEPTVGGVQNKIVTLRFR